jgi:hypothetical protein
MPAADRSLGATWAVQIEEVVTGLRDWRSAHPHATFTEIEAAIDDRLTALRARMIEEAALAAAVTGPVPPACVACGGPLHPRGQHTRQVRVQGDQPVQLHRPYLVCSRCDRGLFPPG